VKRITGLSGERQSEDTEFRKGLKWRMDSTYDGGSVSTIYDLGTGRVATLWPNAKRAYLSDSKQELESFAKRGFPATKVSIMPTGQSRQIAGSTCTVHRVKASYAYSEMERTPAMTMVMEGSICVVKNGPGQADFSAFYRASSESVWVLERQMAELGVLFATQLTTSVGGDTPMGEMMKAIDTHTTEVSSVSTAPIPDSMFEIPADYEVIKR
jgi:hypothetical protein